MIPRERRSGPARLLIAVLLAAAVLGGAGTAAARDVFVVLSGGVSPFENNYSQYLQARALAAFFRQRYPAQSVWVFFGAGNVDGQPPIIADVYRQVRRNGVLVDTWLPGVIPGNRPGTRDGFLRALRQEILPAVADGGTLYLVVGDHGSRAERGAREAEINLWSLLRDKTDDRGWRESDADALSVTDLRTALAAGLGKGRVVFTMTQCHSGGFQFLTVPRVVTANPAWFTAPPPAARSTAAPALNAAGFTSTDEQSIAAGCDPSPDPERWSGYERLMPEQLTGRDLFTGRDLKPPVNSFAEAHVAATLADQTIDKPYSTSDQYLERWASLIETRLAASSTLTPRVSAQVAAFSRAVDTNAFDATDPAFRSRLSEHQALMARMSGQNERVRTLISSGTRQQLERAIRSGRVTAGESEGPARSHQPNREPPVHTTDAELHRLWRTVVAPAWRAAVRAGAMRSEAEPVVAFEQHLLDEEDEQFDFLVDGPEDTQEELFWYAGYGDPAHMNAAEAERLSMWAAVRVNRILAWASGAREAGVRAAGAQLARALTPPTEVEPVRESLTVETAAARALFHRRVLAAWAFLIAMNEQAALQRLTELRALERTPLPAAGGASRP